MPGRPELEPGIGAWRGARFDFRHRSDGLHSGEVMWSARDKLNLTHGGILSLGFNYLAGRKAQNAPFFCSICHAIGRQGGNIRHNLPGFSARRVTVPDRPQIPNQVKPGRGLPASSAVINGPDRRELRALNYLTCACPRPPRDAP
jgi:hypothetical protein